MTPYAAANLGTSLAVGSPLDARGYGTRNAYGSVLESDGTRPWRTLPRRPRRLRAHGHPQWRMPENRRGHGDTAGLAPKAGANLKEAVAR